MALIYPFDETLKGHNEVWSMKTKDLGIPLFVFPKGSFFVANTYAIDKATKKILRPGIDYTVLSCNQDIPFSTNTTTNNKIKAQYVRNAILLKTTEEMELEWHISYCGGEDELKPSEYLNFINSMLAVANTNSTANLLVTPHQGWGVYVSPDNTQIMQGKYIGTHYLLQDEERDEGKIGGLGWGKVELALHSLADVINSGTDPLLLEAFYNWILHNELEFNKVKDAKFKEINDNLENLKGKRVGEEQFVHTSSDAVVPKQNYIEHKNLTLRGINPSETDRQTTTPNMVMRKGVGFFSLAEANTRDGIQATPTILKQLKSQSHVDKRVTVNLSFSEASYSSEFGLVNYQINVEEDLTNNPTFEYTIYVVSKITNRVIQTIKRTPTNRPAHHSVGYNYLTPIDAVDTYFVYALDSNLQLVNGTTATAAVSISNSVDSASAVISGVQNMVTVGEDGNAVGTSEYLEVTITRGNPDKEFTFTISIYDGVEIDPIKTQQVKSYAGINPTVALVDVSGLQPTSGYLRTTVTFLNNTHIIATSLIGVINQTDQKLAYIEMLTADGTATWEASLDATDVLKVTFSEDVRFHETDIIPVLSKITGGTAKCVLGTPFDKVNNTVKYPIIFTGNEKAILTLSVTNDSGTLNSNTINLSVEGKAAAIVNPVLFDAVVRGKNYNSYNASNKWQTMIELSTTAVPDNIIFDITTTQKDIKFASSAVVMNGVLKIKGSGDRFIYEAYNIVLTCGTVKYTVAVPASTTLTDITLVPYVEFTDKLVSDTNIILNEFFDVKITNPIIENTVTLTLRDYKADAGITDIEFFRAGATTAKPYNETKDVFKSTLTVAGGKTAILNSTLCKMTLLESTLNTTTSNNLGNWCPPYDVVVKNASGVVLKTYALETILNLAVYGDMPTTIRNVRTDLPDFDMNEEVEKYILTAGDVPANRTIGSAQIYADSAINLPSNFGVTTLSTSRPTDTDVVIGLSITNLNKGSEIIEPNIQVRIPIMNGSLVDYYLIAIIGVVK